MAGQHSGDVRKESYTQRSRGVRVVHERVLKSGKVTVCFQGKVKRWGIVPVVRQKQIRQIGNKGVVWDPPLRWQISPKGNLRRVGGAPIMARQLPCENTVVGE